MRKFLLCTLAAGLFTFLFTILSVGQQAQRELLTPLSQAPIAVAGNEIGDLLRKWYANGTAAGNAGDYYDNRDGGHSMLNLASYPQLQKIEYTQEQIKARQNWGMQQKTLPFVVFGNSSTSAPPEQAGSNVRSYYTDPRGLAFLFAQYAGNNLYIYPEHLDHDPGHNGLGGYGDLFPTNTPYLIASQGSSGSDQPFMQAMPYVLASFRPEVKKKLIESGLLMPTIQMILRITSNSAGGAREYLTGKAHPTVFQENDVNALAMVEMAHGITLMNLPPIAVIRAAKEDTSVNGIDYFEPGWTEKLADTPAVIARVFRGSALNRKIVVSAEDSRDLNRRPLKFHWAVLRGDPTRIRIEYLNSARSVAEITVPYYERGPIAANSNLESNRVDIGVFVHNGAYYSPPAFITFYTIDSEARTYGADTRPLEIGYGIGTSRVFIANWDAFFELLKSCSDSWPCNFLRARFRSEEISALLETGEEFKKIHGTLLAAQTVADGDKGGRAAEQARKVVNDAQQAEAQILQKKMRQNNLGTAELVQRVLNSLMRDPSLWSANENRLRQLYESSGKDSKEVFENVRDKLVVFGIAESPANLLLRLKPLDGGTPVAGNLTRYEKSMIEQLNATVLSRLLLPGIVNSDWHRNYVDPRISSAKEWRDVFRYSPDGTFLGLRRFQSGGVAEFNAEGLLILDKDALGRCVRGRVVRYELESGQDSSPWSRRVKLLPTDTIREYEYAGINDFKGRVKK